MVSEDGSSKSRSATCPNRCGIKPLVQLGDSEMTERYWSDKRPRKFGGGLSVVRGKPGLVGWIDAVSLGMIETAQKIWRGRLS